MRINQDIRYPEVRVIGADGSQLGIMSSRDAYMMARDQGEDLVEISANAKPPVVKIINYGKFQYQKMKELSKARKNAKSSELKQIRLGLRIGDNDLNIKINKIREFLADGDQVKVTLLFKGREMAHKEVGMALAERIIGILADEATADKPTQAGRNLSFGLRRKSK
ncbi:translation initiation factor IF-3 [Candidatus Saccharibacteria bacterium]|nr:translation initiation factor IF-3 [Candidatus Saccharibacteria bacterium]